MEPVEPETRARDQKAPDLVAAVVEDPALPVRMHALAGISVLVEMRAVESRQSEGVGGEVRRHPVEDHTDPGLMERVDEGRRSRPASRSGRSGRSSRCLVSPRAVERMLHDRHDLDVGEPVVAHVVDEEGSDLRVGERAAALFWHSAPGSEMHLVDRHRLCRGGLSGPRLAIHSQSSHSWPRLEDDRGGLRGLLSGERERIGLVELGPRRGAKASRYL